MSLGPPSSLLVSQALAICSALAFLLTYPYVAAALPYRGRDNGLAYILLVMGCGLWNAMVAAQLLSSVQLVKGFFLTLEMVGALLTGLGWFLFASTASSTPRIPNSRLVYGVVAVLVGSGIILAVTAPVHGWYWAHLSPTQTTSIFLHVEPGLGYWLHTELLVGLFTGGALLFAAAWNAGTSVPYTSAYTIAGVSTAAAVIISNVWAPGAFSIAPLVSVSLTTIGWIQARRMGVIEQIRTLVEGVQP